MHNSLIRNLVIIVGLLAAIYFVYGRYERRQEEVAQRQAENAQIEAEKKSEAEERKNPPPPAVRPQAPVEPEKALVEKEKTQAEELAELRRDLKSGDRTRMPKGAQKIGDSWYLLIEESMTWIEALEFADMHGGRLAVFETGEDLIKVSSQILSNNTAWLGAGDTSGGKFRWVDGSEWQGSSNLEAANRMAAVSGSGKLVSKDSRSLSPFFLEWTESSQPPGSIAALTADFNPDGDAMPVGTITVGKRHYVIFPGAYDWNDAKIKAEQMGASLAVPNTTKEGVLLARLVKFRMPAGVPVWIGGQSDGSAWQWVGDQNAIDVNSAEPTAGHALAIEVSEAKPIVKSYPTANEDGFFMVEWSKFSQDKTAVTKSSPEQVASLLNLREKAAGAVAKIEKERAEEFKTNTKDLAFDLRAWYRTLASIDKAEYAEDYSSILSSLNGQQIPAKPKKLKLAKKAIAIYDRHLTRQDRIDKEFTEKFSDLQSAYLKRLNAMKSDAETESDTAFANRVSAESKRVGQGVDEFLNYLKR